MSDKAELIQAKKVYHEVHSFLTKTKGLPNTRDTREDAGELTARIIGVLETDDNSDTESHNRAEKLGGGT